LFHPAGVWVHNDAFSITIALNANPFSAKYSNTLGKVYNTFSAALSES
jgi:hypothetical protein